MLHINGKNNHGDGFPKLPKVAVGPSRRNHAQWVARFEKDIGSQASNMSKVSACFAHCRGVGRLQCTTCAHTLLQFLAKPDDIDKTEVDWIVAMTHQDRSQEIGNDELLDIKVALARYLQVKEMLTSGAAAFGWDASSMSHAEVKSAMLRLNDGLSVHDKELKWVISSSSKFRQGPEYEQALNVWYNHVETDSADKEVLKKDFTPKGGAVGRAKSSLAMDLALKSPDPVARKAPLHVIAGEADEQRLDSKDMAVHRGMSMVLQQGDVDYGIYLDGTSPSGVKEVKDRVPGNVVREWNLIIGLAKHGTQLPRKRRVDLTPSPRNSPREIVR